MNLTEISTPTPAGSYYIRDPYLRSHLALVYSQQHEIATVHGDTDSLTAMNMRHFTGFTILPYETLAQQPGPDPAARSRTSRT